MYLRDILAYLRRSDVQFYRLSSTLLPSTTTTHGYQQLAACRRELDTLAELVQAQQVRLTMHMPPQVALAHPDAAQVARSLHQIELQAALLDALGSGPEGSIVVHVGGSATDPASLSRFARCYGALSERARARLVVEHDSAGFGLGHVLHLHQMCGIPVVFDYLHWQLHNPEQLPLKLALGLALATWPPGVRPKVHLSSARSEAHLLPDRHGNMRVLPPRRGQHADFVAVSDALCLFDAARGFPVFDTMIEAKGGDMALFRLRDELQWQGQK
jgi:UV DNA damage endonuclease